MSRQNKLYHSNNRQKRYREIIVKSWAKKVIVELYYTWIKLNSIIKYRIHETFGLFRKCSIINYVKYRNEIEHESETISRWLGTTDLYT